MGYMRYSAHRVFCKCSLWQPLQAANKNMFCFGAVPGCHTLGFSLWSLRRCPLVLGPLPAGSSQQQGLCGCLHRELYWALESDMYGYHTGGVTGSRRFSRCLACAIGKPGAYTPPPPPPPFHAHTHYTLADWRLSSIASGCELPLVIGRTVHGVNMEATNLLLAEIHMRTVRGFRQ